MICPKAKHISQAKPSSLDESIMKLEDLVQGLPSTDRLYLRDSYLTRFSAKVLRAEKEGKNKIYFVLDATAFHQMTGRAGRRGQD
jgi:hypothetical protein